MNLRWLLKILLISIFASSSVAENKYQIAKQYQACETAFFDNNRIVADTINGIVKFSKTRSEIHAENFIEAQLGHIFALFSINVHKLDMSHVQKYTDRAKETRVKLLQIAEDGLDIPYDSVNPRNHRALFDYYGDLGRVGRAYAKFRDRKKDKKIEYQRFLDAYNLINIKVRKQAEAIKEIRTHLEDVGPILEGQIKTRKESYAKAQAASSLLAHIERRLNQLLDGIKERGVELDETQRKNIHEIFVPAIRDVRKVVDDVLSQEVGHIEFIQNHITMINQMRTYVVKRHLKLMTVPVSLMIEAQMIFDKVLLGRMHEVSTANRRNRIQARADRLEEASRRGHLTDEERIELNDIPEELDALAASTEKFKQSLGDPADYSRRLIETVHEGLQENDNIGDIISRYTERAKVLDIEAVFDATR